MKNKIIYTIFAVVGLFATTRAQNNSARNVLYVQGIGVTSKDWAYFQNNAQVNGYQIQPVNAVWDANYQPQTNTVAVSADQLNTFLQTNNRTNVLGIGHDGGGIVLRKMANNTDSRLSGIILERV
jgi:triacylglycerol esterase/lipase EstA (alpha/beta hydrolase family)